jgi:alanine racemase
MRPTWVDIDLGTIRSNVSKLKALAGDAAMCAVVKANAYGHGTVPVAQAAVDAGASWLAVALVEEAAELRAGGLEVPILVLSEPTADGLAGAAKLGGVRPTVYSEAAIDAYAAAAPGAPVHLKIDTGMNRVGAAPADAVGLARRALGAGLVLEGVFTHFAAADDPTSSLTGVQTSRFDGVLADLAEAGIS